MYTKLMTEGAVLQLDLGLLVIVELVAIILLAIFSIVTFIMLCKLKSRYLRFSQGRDAQSLESEVGLILEQNKELRAQTEENRLEIGHIYKVLENTYQKCGLVKYDAYSQMGGKLSYILVMLNEKDDGFIMNSIHGTDGCFSYIKNVKAGKCNSDLGNEEKEALSQAINGGK